MTRNRVPLALAVGASSVLLAACGSSHSSASSPSSSPSATATPTATPTATVVAAKEAFKRSLLSNFASQSPPIPYDAAGAQCVANSVVDHLGLAKLKTFGRAYQLTGGMSLSTGDATYFATRLVDCAPRNSIVRFFRQRMNEGMGTIANDTQKACMDKVLTRQASIELLTSEYNGQAAAGKAAFKSLMTAAAPTCGIG